MSEKTIISPKTSKRIIVNGPTYNKLLTTKYAQAVKAAPRTTLIRQSRQHQTGKVPKTITLQKSPLRKTSGRGSKTKGWKDAAPERGAERAALKHKCGKECFLKPDSNGFPICAALRSGKGCKVDCRGIIAAKVRSGQWDYKDVREAAEKLGKKYKC